MAASPPRGEDPCDSVLAERVARGDAAAFGIVFDRYAQLIARFCWRRVSEPAAGVDAEDLMSLVFLEAWAARDRILLVDESLRPWLFGVATNVVRNQRRTWRRHRAAMARLPHERAAADGADDVVRRVDAAGEARAVLRSLDRLSRREREVIELCVIEGLGASAVAAALGIPEGTVKSRLARARSRLHDLGRSGDLTDPGGFGGHEQGEHAARASVPGSAAWNL